MRTRSLDRRADHQPYHAGKQALTGGQKDLGAKSDIAGLLVLGWSSERKCQRAGLLVLGWSSERKCQRVLLSPT